MLQTIKAIISFIQVFILSVGIIPANYEIDYGGQKYTPPVVSKEMAIVLDGASDYSIVIADDADECIKTAAKEMQTYVEKISGALLPIVNESDFPEDAKAIVLGETHMTDNVAELKDSQIGEDGFRLYCDGEDFYILGEDSRGTLYGVYTFLEEYLGVRWFTPELEVVPESEKIVIDKALDRIVEPSFVVRRNSCIGSTDEYRTKMKTNVSFWTDHEKHGGALSYVLWDGGMQVLIPDSLFAEHPDYFAQQPNGTRSTDQICLSNPEVLKVAIENARKEILACERDAKYIHICQKDNQNYCHCDTCEAIYEKYGAVSAATILFTNAFADALDDEFPDFTFTFFAYNETERPPKDLSLRCNANVAPVLCGLHHACRSHPLTECGAEDTNEEFLNLYGDNHPQIAEDFKTWTKLADKTYIYDYTINFLWSAQFFSNFGTMQSTMKYFSDIGITGYMYTCGDGHSGAFNELRNYLLCKVQWDVDCDVEYHMMDFLKAYYGEEAAPYIKEIIDIQTGQIAATAHAFDFDWHYQSGYYPIHIILKLDNLWEKALGSNITAEQKFNVEAASLSWEFFKANQFLGEYFFLNPGRAKAQEKLYDELISHGITKVSSFSDLPAKDEVNFNARPIEW